MLIHQEELNTITSTLTTRHSFITAGFTTREAGDCRQIEVIKRHLKANYITPRKIVLLEQIHSSNVSKPDPTHLGDIELLEDSDGVLTKEPGACLVIRVADCVPILYFDPVRRVIGASHNGWRGTEKNLVGEMIQIMQQNGSKNEDIHVIIGPAINACCYDIDLDRYAQFMETMERFNKVAFRPHGEGFHMNLVRLNYELALETGIYKRNIDYFPFCTSCDAKRFYSFRRQYKTHPHEFGEMMGYIMLT